MVQFCVIKFVRVIFSCQIRCFSEISAKFSSISTLYDRHFQSTFWAQTYDCWISDDHFSNGTSICMSWFQFQCRQTNKRYDTGGSSNKPKFDWFDGKVIDFLFYYLMRWLQFDATTSPSFCFQQLISLVLRTENLRDGEINWVDDEGEPWWDGKWKRDISKRKTKISIKFESKCAGDAKNKQSLEYLHYKEKVLTFADLLSYGDDEFRLPFRPEVSMGDFCFFQQ